MAYYVKLFLDAFDGDNADLSALTPTQRYIWFALIAFARRYPPHGFLSIGICENQPVAASIRRLAEWAGVSLGVMQKTLGLLLNMKMLKQDKRRSNQCLEVTNWCKWQVEHGTESEPADDAKECSPYEQQPPDGVHDMNAGVHHMNTAIHEMNASVHHMNTNLPGEGVHDMNTPPDEANGENGSGDLHLVEDGVHDMNALESHESLGEGRKEDVGDSLHVDDGQRPTAPPGSNDKVRKHQELVARCVTLLSQVNPDDGAPVKQSVENTILLYPDHAELAALKTTEKKRANPPKRWLDVSQYFASTASGMASDAREAEERDPALSEFTKLYGPDPHLSPAHPSQRQWERYRRDHKDDSLMFIYSHAELQDRAQEVGLWDNARKADVETRIIQGGDADE